MQYLVLGLAALGIALLLTTGFTRANAAAMAKALKLTVGIAALAMALVLVVRGVAGYAVGMALLGLWLLASAGGGASGGFGWPKAGRQSSVRTSHLEMQLDHDSGEMTGRIIKGVFAGRTLQSMAPAELALLWRDCQFADPQSAELIEAYLDRRHPSWREDMARAEAEPGAGGVMTEAEAWDILGLKPGASADDIRRAHRELMLKLHPDRGGSTYLASKINEAKALLLGKG
jgi:hypothetical protein